MFKKRYRIEITGTVIDFAIMFIISVLVFYLAVYMIESSGNTQPAPNRLKQHIEWIIDKID